MKPLFIFLICAILGLLVAFPEIDLLVSGAFHCAQSGFFLRDNVILLFFEKTAFHGSRLMAASFVVFALIGFVWRRTLFSFSGKEWVFLLLCLLIGPGLLANVVFKDNWGRARPRDIAHFDGMAKFTPAAYITDQCDRNCSFVSGDASFGFFLTSFAYVVSRRRRRAVFWSLLGIGSLFAGARVLLGAHFISDILFALVLVHLVSAGLYAAMYGLKALKERWEDWMPLVVKGQ